MFKRNVNRSPAGNIFVFFMLIILGAFLVLPLIYVVGAAFKTLNEIYIFPPHIIPHDPTSENFVHLNQILSNSWVPLSRYLFNSVFVSIVSTIGHILLASMAAYPLAKHDFVGKKFVGTVVKLSLLFTASVIYIPQYIVFSQLHLINSYLAIILPALQSSLGLYLMQNFMVQIPNAMIEAARIDGAGEAKIFFTMIMPNVKPAWLTLMIFSFQGIWNTTGGTMIYKEEIKTLPSILSQLASGGIVRAGVTSAATLIMIVPPILLFILSQNKVIETMSASGMK